MATGFTNIGSGGGLKNLTATPAEVKQGYTFSRDGKTVESGTMNLGNLLPENIRAGVNIAGVVGVIDLGNLTAENIKKGVVVAGITGELDPNVAKVKSFYINDSEPYLAKRLIKHYSRMGRITTFRAGSIKGTISIRASISGGNKYSYVDVEVGGTKISLKNKDQASFNVHPGAHISISESSGTTLGYVTVAFEIVEGPQYFD